MDQERTEAERLELERKCEEQERLRMEQERFEAERLELERKCEEHERQRMELERIEAELGRSVELERQRVERECTEKARAVERRTKLDANAAVWVPANTGEVERVERECTEKLRLLERLNAWMRPATGKLSVTVESKKPRCVANEGERRSRQCGTKLYGSRQSESRGTMVSGSPMTTVPSRRKSGWSSRTS